jgi:hypothetical protein
MYITVFWYKYIKTSNINVIHFTCNGISPFIPLLFFLIFQGSRHETLRDTLAVGKILLATINAWVDREHSVRHNSDDCGNYFHYVGNWSRDSSTISRNGALGTETETIQKFLIIWRETNWNTANNWTTIITKCRSYVRVWIWETKPHCMNRSDVLQHPL